MTEAQEDEYAEFEDDGLGYYEDGVQRTLTDEQIAMFRHTEIQTILRERRRRKEAGLSLEAENMPPKPAEEPVPVHLAFDGSSVPNAQTPKSPVQDPPTGSSTPVAAQASTEKKDFDNGVKDSRVEKKSQWRLRSKEHQKRRNTNYRRNKKQKKIEAKKQSREGSMASGQTGDNSESDEWDPWHQANGPDAQKDDTAALEY
jgi:hypothetical protein